MKAILEFTLPEEREEFETAVKAPALQAALWDVAQEVFRPARKHGYVDSRLQKMMEEKDGEELIGELETLFFEILRRHGVEL
jgi:hypothetical protein